jgi:hypothetical protein
MQMRNEDDADRVADAIEAPDVGDAVAAKKNAEAILARDRATVEEIAWAWVTLRDLDADNGITSGEARYRKILFAQEEIEKLGLLKTDEAGFPVRKYSGVPVSGMNDGVVVRGLVSVSAVRDAFTAGGVSWPGPRTLPVAGADAGTRSVVNTTGGRRHQLDHVIDRVIEQIRGAGGIADVAAVWNELKELALNADKPFTGMVGNDLEYTSGEGEKVLYTRDALRKKLSRRDA